MGHGCHDCDSPNGCVCNQEPKEKPKAKRFVPKGDVWDIIWQKVEHNQRLDGQDFVILFSRLLGISCSVEVKDLPESLKACSAELLRLKSKKQLCLVCFQKSDRKPFDPDPGIPMRLNCPECGKLHIDEGEFATKPHHTHACQECGHVWRPAVIPTTGVRFLPGFKNEPKTPNASAKEPT